MDQSAKLASTLHDNGSSVRFARLRGTHLTPVIQGIALNASTHLIMRRPSMAPLTKTAPSQAQTAGDPVFCLQARLQVAAAMPKPCPISGRALIRESA